MMERKLRGFLLGSSERGRVVQEELGHWSCVWLEKRQRKMGVAESSPTPVASGQLPLV